VPIILGIIIEIGKKSDIPYVGVYFMVLWDGGSGYKTYVFEESTRRCAVDRKDQGCKEVMYHA